MDGRRAGGGRVWRDAGQGPQRPQQTVRLRGCRRETSLKLQLVEEEQSLGGAGRLKQRPDHRVGTSSQKSNVIEISLYEP